MSTDIETQLADDGVATLTLARAERWNALSIKRRDEITQQLEDWVAGWTASIDCRLRCARELCLTGRRIDAAEALPRRPRHPRYRIR